MLELGGELWLFALQMNFSTRSLLALALFTLPVFAQNEIPEGWETKRLTPPGCFRRVIIAGARKLLPRNLDLATTQRLSRLAYYYSSKSAPALNALERESVYRVVGTGRSEYLALYNITHDLHYTIWRIDGATHLRVELMDANWLMNDSNDKVQFKLGPTELVFLSENRDPLEEEALSLERYNNAALTYFQSNRLRKLREVFWELNRPSGIASVSIQGEPEVLWVSYKTQDRKRNQKCVIRAFPTGFRWVLIDQQDQVRSVRTGAYNYAHFGILTHGGMWLGDAITQRFMGKPVGFEDLAFSTLWNLSRESSQIPEWAD
jgi:hypothetical protein